MKGTYGRIVVRVGPRGVKRTNRCGDVLYGIWSRPRSDPIGNGRLDICHVFVSLPETIGEILTVKKVCTLFEPVFTLTSLEVATKKLPTELNVDEVFKAYIPSCLSEVADEMYENAKASWGTEV